MLTIKIKCTNIHKLHSKYSVWCLIHFHHMVAIIFVTVSFNFIFTCNIYRSDFLHTAWTSELTYMILGSSNQSWILLPSSSFLQPLWSLQDLIPRLWWCHFLLYLNTISLLGFNDSPWLGFILYISASQDSLAIKNRKPLEKFQERW